MKTTVLGLTGQSGAGKTTVSGILASRLGEQMAWIDADVIAREVVQSGQACLVELVLAFSSAILQADGTLDRHKLGSMVFADRAKLRKLNHITLPYILEEIQRRIDQARKQGISLVLVDAPTLFESGADKLCDLKAAVLAPYELRLDRILRRDGISREDAQNRLRSQHEDSYYEERADFVLRNGEEAAQLGEQVDQLLAFVESRRCAGEQTG